MSINLNNTLPAAPLGGQNILWQQDTSGNVSAYTSLSDTMTTVVPVAGVVTLNCAMGNVFLIQVTMAVTSVVVTNPTAGTFSSQQFVYNLADTNFFALSTGVQGMI